MATKIFHPLLALIISATNNELARYVEFLKEENKILRAQVCPVRRITTAGPHNASLFEMAGTKFVIRDYGYGYNPFQVGLVF